MKKISTSQLSKKLNIPSPKLFETLESMGFIEKKHDAWELTQDGISNGGGEYKNSKFGKYIAWNEDLKLDDIPSSPQESISATVIGEKFNISARRINHILSELGWIKKHPINGWELTVQGEKVGGIQLEHKTSGVPFVKWEKRILDHKALQENAGDPDTEGSEKRFGKGEDFRSKFEANYRAKDGHFVRSRGEVIVDDWLYTAEITHAYERKLPIEEDVYTDFYIPAGKVYIEVWGYEDDEKYLKRKNRKIEIYKKYGFSLIEIDNKIIENIDDHLPRLLLKYGIKSY